MEEDLSNISNMSVEDLQALEFRPFNTNDGTLIMLIPSILYPLVPKGTEIISIHGDKLTIGIHRIEETPFAGYISYGVIPKMSTNKLSVSQIIYIGKVRQSVRNSFPDFINKVYINGETGDIIYIKESTSSGRKKYYTVKETGILNFTYNRITDLNEIDRLLSICTP